MSDTPLATRIRLLIEANGPMSVADYMALCLTDPQHGYYATRDPLGACGDFITSPEVSQIFGEIVGAWLIHTWQLVGSPSPVTLVELGPGRGTLMADILRVAKGVGDFCKAVSIHLVETNAVLRARQAEMLAAWGAKIAWHESFDDTPRGPLLLVANEFFDALPIRQFVRVGGAWRERVVGLDRAGNLVFGIGAAALDEGPSAPAGAIFEVRPGANATIAEIARRVVEENGAGLIIDYGHAETASGETLQAVRRHAYADPLQRPGEADLTAHVDFAALVRAARSAGAATHGPMPQGDFLLTLGLAERAGRLAAGADAATGEVLQVAVERLAGPKAMGALFKVLALTRPGIVPPPFVE